MKTITVKPILIDSNIHNPLRTDENGILAFEPHIVGLHYGGLSHAYKELILFSLDDEIKINDEYHFEGLINKADTTLSLSTAIHIKADKIIARQPEISPEYIQQFIEEYNSNTVKDIDIEMEEIYQQYFENGDFHKNAFKFQPKLTNGFITIHNTEYKKEHAPIPMIYTEAEVFNLIEQFAIIEGTWVLDKLKGKVTSMPDLAEWFNQNKKKQL